MMISRKSRALRVPLLLIFTSLLLAACSGNGRVAENPLLRFFERKSGLIAYVGLDGNVYTMNQAGEDVLPITLDAILPEDDPSSISAEESILYELPTWAQDGSLAFIQRSAPAMTPDDVQASILWADLNSDPPVLSKIYSSDTEIPSYLYWRPGTAQISFLTSTVRHNSQILKLVGTDGNLAETLDVGYPYFYSWAPDGSKLIKHAGGGPNPTALERVAFVMPGETETTESMLSLSPSAYSAPAFSSTGEHIVIAAVSEDGQQGLALTDANGNYIETLKSYQGTAAFALSPDGIKLAVLERYTDENGEYKSVLSIMDLRDLTSETVLVEDNVLAFFWSPDSEKIAYFLFNSASQEDFFQQEAENLPVETTATPEGEETPAAEATPEEDTGDEIPVINLRVYQLGDEESSLLINFFRPSPVFFRMLLDFDQFQYSATIWSPDSRNLVIAGTPTIDNPPSIMVVSATGAFLPRYLQPGVIAFWSWN